METLKIKMALILRTLAEKLDPRRPIDIVERTPYMVRDQKILKLQMLKAEHLLEGYDQREAEIVKDQIRRGFVDKIVIDFEQKEEVITAEFFYYA